MGNYTQIADLGARHRARSRSKGRAPRAEAGPVRPMGAELCCPGCGTTSFAAGTCDECALPFVDALASVAVASDLSRLRSGAREAAAALIAVGVATPVALAVVGHVVATLPEPTLPAVVAWPVVATMVGAAAAVVGVGAAASLATRLAGTLRSDPVRGRGAWTRGTVRIERDGDEARLYLVPQDGARIRVPVERVRVERAARVRLADGDEVEVRASLASDVRSGRDYRGFEREARFVGDVRVRVR